MNFDKLYDQLVARKESRESATLTMMTLASSASLILFVFFLNENSSYQYLVSILGILFPLVAIGYREINFYYIQPHDNSVINAILLKEFGGTDEQKKEIKDAIYYRKHRRIKIFLLRFLMVLPIFGWIMSFDYFVGFIINFIIVMNIAVFSWKNSRFREPKDDIPSFLKDYLDVKMS